MTHSLPLHDAIDLVTRLISLVAAIGVAVKAFRWHRRRRADREPKKSQQ